MGKFIELTASDGHKLAAYVATPAGKARGGVVIARRTWQPLRTVGRALMSNHLKHCASHAITHGSAGEADATYKELLDLIYKHAR